ncbi:MAG: hypothetical protein ACRDGW_01330, partial [Actinomycetota bacterium]
DQAAAAPRVYEAAREVARPARRSSPARAADGAERHPSNGHSILDADDLVNIVVRPARQRVGVAGV